MNFKTIEWKGDRVRVLDQRRLPRELRYLECKDPEAVAHAIRTMAIRGAPAIGVAAAMGIALAAKKIRLGRTDSFRKRVGAVCHQMRQTRPTAVNLFWAVNRMMKILDPRLRLSAEEIRRKLEDEALQIYEEDVEANRRIGENGKILLRDGNGIITHCNAGSLATAGYGTALGVIYAARAEGKRLRVFVDETRPMLQGARLTAWELVQEKIPTTLITDSMAGALMKRGEIDLAIVGADRIARNGDTANKIGTYGLAILSRWHGIPFYVAAPTSTLDLTLASGSAIPIEERSPEEVTHLMGKPVSPREVDVFNPAFDVTPHSLVDAIITEKGIARKPFQKNLKKIKDGR